MHFCRFYQHCGSKGKQGLKDVALVKEHCTLDSELLVTFKSLNNGSFEAQYKHQSLLFEIQFDKLFLGKKLFLSNYRR